MLYGKTSIFTIKGHFPKAVLGGYILKRKKDAYLEYPAYLIGKQLGMDIAECSIENEYVKIKIFTDDTTSLIHANELEEYFSNGLSVYDNIMMSGRKDLKEQLQKLCIYNYIIGNPDVHSENYGFLYNSDTFELLKVAPCFDHNIAFNSYFSGKMRENLNQNILLQVDKIAEENIILYKDIVDKVRVLDYIELSKYLNKTQIKLLKKRVDNLLYWYKIGCK